MSTILDNDLTLQHQQPTNFFDSDSYFIDEKVNFFKFENAYKVFNDRGETIGSIAQHLSITQKIVQLFISKKMLPFRLDIKDVHGQVQASIKRGWTFWMSKISILNADGVQIGTIQQKFTFFKPTFRIINNDAIIAEITGDWKAWNFIIKDAAQVQIGDISKKWAGAVKELFTTADKYKVHIDPAYAHPEQKIAILACAISIDMILKEKK